MEFLIPFALRLVGSLVILRRPFWGMVLAVLLDALDFNLTSLSGGIFFDSYTVNFSVYALLDKIFDTYVAILALLAAMNWELLARRVLYVLFSWRLVGFVLFLVIGARQILFFFPNLFEFFFLFYAFALQYKSKLLPRNFAQMIIVLLLLLTPKLAQEYILHILDAAPLAYIKHDILGWPR